MKISKKIRAILIALVLIMAGVMLMNLDVSIRQSVDGRRSYVHMPLYAKWTQFLARHYEYGRLAREITRDCRTDEEKVLAILKWTRENLKDVPPTMPICDDHTLYIIIRGYGVPGQFQDVFTTLCAYAGIPAFFEKAYDRERKNKYSLSFVKLHGKWRVFDAYYGKYFNNNSGEIASVEDIRNDHSLIKGDDVNGLLIRGIPYKEYYYYIDLNEALNGTTLRPYRQMPLSRICFEMKKALRLGKEE